MSQIGEALRRITELLAREIRTPTSDCPAWSEFEWCIARAVVAMQGVSSILLAGSKWPTPTAWRSFLEAQQRHVAGRHARIADLLGSIDSLARRDRIMLIALKGAALHSLGIYRAGERPMADVDLLVDESDVTRVMRLLGECGYELTATTWRNWTLEARERRGAEAARLGEHVDNPIKIEIHTRICERLPISESDITRFVVPGAGRVGLCGYPSVASLMLHLLLHAAGNMRANAVRMIQLHDIALLAAKATSSDWNELMAARPNGEPLWWAVPPLMLTDRYYPGSIPASVIEADHGCTWLLKRLARRQLLSDVSWSNIRVHALPGITWSRTVPEAGRFLISRIWPNRSERSELEHFAQHHPGAMQVPWYGLSQGARILRWMFSRPPRVQTLISVRAAIDQADSDGSKVAEMR